ncbi:MAG: hypothetical protein C0415_05945 [Thermodesulfovibrio sp.]|nr:hypothetical protein [Thermodesulfovibrio sp.]
MVRKAKDKKERVHFGTQLDVKLIPALKHMAIKRKQSIFEFIEEALKKHLKSCREQTKRKKTSKKQSRGRHR